MGNSGDLFLSQIALALRGRIMLETGRLVNV